ncbi:hypothetical protein [Arthrobacter sp. SPG23]|uniref:hypothetical protein n=1 Tax=Arthrobacter sp. SPG23 TaxID=1610703 RepID=UPI00136492C6|nr:hypothetical protein [Arthrobacter sp. SPG23]
MMVVNRDLGPPVPLRPDDRAMEQPTKSGVFNRTNWDRLHPALDETLVDSNASPVLLWIPAETGSEVIGVSQRALRALEQGAGGR